MLRFRVNLDGLRLRISQTDLQSKALSFLNQERDEISISEISREIVSLGTFGPSSGFVPGGEKMNAVGNGTAIPEIPCTNDGTKYSARKYYFQP